MSLVFATSEKLLIIQLINIVMNNKSTQNTQENVVKYSFIEYSIFHAILQKQFSIKLLSKSPLNEKSIILDRTYFWCSYLLLFNEEKIMQ